MKRKLVSIQEIKEIIPIEDADSIEVIKIMGWQCVSKKGDFKVGDKCVYFEVDSYLPIEERYEFLRTSSYRKNEYIGEGFRIKTIKLRGQLSQGLAIPISLYPNLSEKQVGDDVTDILGVVKWEMPEVQGSNGVSIGDKPFGIPTTDELRVQSIEIFIENLKGHPFYITTKMDGTSCSMYHNNGQVGVTGRNEEFKDDDTNSFWKYAKEKEILVKLKETGKNYVIQGEFCGHGIQKNRLKLKKPEFFAFDVYNLDEHKYLDYFSFVLLMEKLEVKTVPIEEVGDSFNYTLEQLLEKAKGKYESGENKEGIVVRPIFTTWVKEISNRLSFKVLNNDFLLKEK